MRWVVVGAGSAGCVVAARLSERSGDEVVLLEAGPDHGDGTVVGDVGPLLDDASRRRDDLMVRRPGRPAERYVRGHGVAGSSLINGGVVTDPRSPSEHLLPLQDPWTDGAVGGALLASDPAARRVRLVRRGDRRVTAADAYLRPVLHRPNLTVRPGVTVRRLALGGRAVVGVISDSEEIVEADRVVMCAGAIHTPAILLRSGVDTAGVGADLQDHPAFTITLRLKPGRADPAAPTISVAADHRHYQVLALNHVDDEFDLGALVVALVDPQSRGAVRLVDDEPVVELGQLGDPLEVDRMAAAVASTAALLGDDVWRDIVDEVYVDDVGTTLASIASDRQQLGTWIAEHIGGYFHAACTCREGVVTDGGVVRGYDGLYVADAAALAALPHHDPYVHVITNADRLARAW